MRLFLKERIYKIAMGKLKKEWAQLLPFEKVFYVLGLTLALAVIVLGILAVLQNLDLIFLKVQLLPWCVILLGLENLSMAVYEWRRTRSTAIVSLCCGVFVLVCAVIRLILMR